MRCKIIYELSVESAAVETERQLDRSANEIAPSLLFSPSVPCGPCHRINGFAQPESLTGSATQQS